MGTRSVMEIIIMSLLVLLALGWGPASSEALDSIHGNSGELHSSNVAEDFSRATASRATTQCPSVCPACPSLPGCPACPAAPPCPSAAPCPRHIPPGYQLYDGLGYYRMHYAPKKWHDAEMVCEAEGAYLVVINSQNEADLITSLMTKHGLTGLVHLGFNDITKKGKYVTVLGDDLLSTGYSIWVPKQPTGVGKEFCGAFEISKGIHDIYCTDEYPFLCELDQ